LTAIVGIQGKGWAVIASDSMTTYTDKPYIAKGYDKIVKVNEYLIVYETRKGKMIDIYWQLQWYLLDLEFYKFILEHLIKWGL
jgi:hypothetical protein